MNILFVRLSYIGDILHATAAARWIKQQYPDAKLHWIVTPSMAELLEHNPYVDVIIPWARDEYEAYSKKLHLPKMWSMWWQLRKQLKPYRFDVAIDVQGRLITGLVLLASGAPLRLGLGHTKELNWLFTNRKARHQAHHVIERYLEVAQLMPQYVETSDINRAIESSTHHMDLFLTEEERNYAEKQIDTFFESSCKPRIGLVLGTSWLSKEWPPYKWQQLVESLAYRSDFICLGGLKEAAEYKSFIEGVKANHIMVYNCLGQTTLREMAAMISQCDVVVACDTGGLHMALALGVPVVALFGPTAPNEWGPIQGTWRVIQNHDVPCLGCRKRKCPKGKSYCMTGIDPVKVKEAIIELLAKT